MMPCIGTELVALVQTGHEVEVTVRSNSGEGSVDEQIG